MARSPSSSDNSNTDDTFSSTGQTDPAANVVDESAEVSSTVDLIDGEPVPNNGDINLQSALQSGIDASATASALSAALDETLEQGGVPSDPNLNEVASDQALLDEANLDQDENQDDVDELFS